MASVNKVILVGNLGKDAERIHFQNGGGCVRFSVATSESWKDKNSGEKKERTEWHNVVVFQEALIKWAEKLKKGNRVYIEGRIVTRKWQDQHGQDRWSTEIHVNGFNCQLISFEKREGGAFGQAPIEEEESRGPTSMAQDMNDETPF